MRPRPSSPRRAFWLGALVMAATGALAFFWGSRPQRPPAPPGPAGSSTVPAQRPREPDKAKDLIAKAAAWQRDGDTGAARDLLEQAVQLDPDNAEAHYRLGNLFLNSQPQRARAEYEASMRLDPHKYGEVVRAILKDL